MKKLRLPKSRSVEWARAVVRRLATPGSERVELCAKSIFRGHLRVSYRGVQAIRCPFDYVIYQMILYEVQPDLVIEVGTNIGGGALYLADLLSNLQHGILHTIDIKPQSAAILSDHPRIRLFTNGYENYDIDNARSFGKVLVIEDASHMYEDSLGIMTRFAPVVTPGSYLIVEDGIVNELGMGRRYHGGPLRAINEFLKTHPEFEIDRQWCDYFGQNATFNVNGYLRKALP
jgi:cephalosporin hydroxylase